MICFGQVLKATVSWLDLDELLTADVSSYDAQYCGDEASMTITDIHEEQFILPATVGGGCSQPIAIQPHHLRRIGKNIQKDTASDELMPESRVGIGHLAE
jgi:hypothetical protein